LKNDSQFKDLLKELNRDPRLKRVIAKRRSRGKDGGKIEQAADIVRALLGIVSRLTTKKKARALEELMDAIYLLVQVSLLLKENVFDRPEVQRFFRQKSKQIYSLVQEYVAVILPRAKEVRRMRKPRPS
jgi:hypothetical protein